MPILLFRKALAAHAFFILLRLCPAMVWLRGNPCSSTNNKMRAREDGSRAARRSKVKDFQRMSTHSEPEAPSSSGRPRHRIRASSEMCSMGLVYRSRLELDALKDPLHLDVLGVVYLTIHDYSIWDTSALGNRYCIILHTSYNLLSFHGKSLEGSPLCWLS